MKVYFIPFFLLFLTIQACKTKTSNLDKYDRANLLQSIASNVITPAYTDFKNATGALSTATNDFTNNPNQTSLTAAQIAFENTLDKWMYCEAFNFEYASTTSLQNQIATTPVNFAVIESELLNNNVDEAYINATGTTRKGLAAIEYLLYYNVLDSFNLSSNATNRKQYLTALVQHLRIKATQANTEWNNGASYNSFTSKTKLDIGGSLNALVNAFAEHIELVRKGKIGKPAGIENNGLVDTTGFEYRLSARSLKNIEANIKAWKAIYTSNSGVGLDDYLDFVDAKYNGNSLSTTITAQLDACLAKTAAINSPLTKAALTQVNEVKELHLEIKKLTVLTKVDLASNLGVIITFSDNDGD
jgi:predicted lipoprotein